MAKQFEDLDLFTQTTFSWIYKSKLWLVLDAEAARPRSLPEVTEQCADGGVDVVVFRMKDRPTNEALPIALEVHEICQKKGAAFVISHDLKLAEYFVGAIHVGASCPPIKELRTSSFLDPDEAIGYSAHSVDEARNIVDVAEYFFLGPIFDTPSKRDYGPPLGVGVIPDAEKLDIPAIYIGGMNEQTIPLAVAAGAKRVAAISALLSVPEPRAAAERLRALLQ